LCAIIILGGRPESIFSGKETKSKLGQIGDVSAITTRGEIASSAARQKTGPRSCLEAADVTVNRHRESD
jgi:hypothetical protein